MRRRTYTTTKRRACDGKPDLTEAAARAWVRRLEAHGTAPGRATAYDCKHCDHWHVGHTHRSRS